MTCICGHHEHAHAQGVGMCGAPEGCDCNSFDAFPPEREPYLIEWDRAAKDAEWLSGSKADTAERNLARAYLAMCEEVAEELAEAQADKERLDWFDRVWADDDTNALDKAWQSSTPGPAGSGRAGIDAARAAEPPVDILSDDWWDRETKREA